MNNRNEYENEVRWSEVIYSVEFLGILAIIAVLAASTKSNYFPLACLCFCAITVFDNGNIHFHKNKLIRWILKKKPHIAKCLLMLILAISMVLSWYSFKALIFSIVLSIIWTEYMKLFKRRKCHKLGF